MSEDILQCIRELESINIAETELNMGIDHELGEAKNFTTQVESISETRLFTLLSSQSSGAIFNGENAVDNGGLTLQASSSYCSQGEDSSGSTRA